MRDRGWIQARIERTEDGARHRDAEVRLDNSGNIRCHAAHCVSGPNSTFGQRIGQRAASALQLLPGSAEGSVDDSGAVRVDGGGPIDQCERCESAEVGLTLLQEGSIVHRHCDRNTHG